MPTRFLRESITTSETIDALSDAAEAFFYRLITKVDDFGRMEGMPFLLMVQRKVHWIQKHHEHLVEIAEG